MDNNGGNRPNQRWPVYVSSSSPGGGNGSEVCHLGQHLVHFMAPLQYQFVVRDASQPVKYYFKNAQEWYSPSPLPKPKAHLHWSGDIPPHFSCSWSPITDSAPSHLWHPTLSTGHTVREIPSIWTSFSFISWRYAGSTAFWLNSAPETFCGWTSPDLFVFLPNTQSQIYKMWAPTPFSFLF